MKQFSSHIQPKTAVFSFCRMNPPTIGHQKLVETILETAKTNNATPYIFISNSENTTNNPIRVEQKLKYIKTAFSSAASHIHNSSTIKTPIEAFNYLVAEGYTKFIMAVGEDRVEQFKSSFFSLIEKYHPQILPENFSMLNVGLRQGNTPTEQASSTKMREFVAKGDYTNFRKFAPTTLDDSLCQEMFDSIKRSPPTIVEGATNTNTINTDMKTFKSFLTEGTPNKTPSNLALAISRQKREIGDQEKRHRVELEKARETDFKSREDKKRNKETKRTTTQNAKVAKMHRDREIRFRKREQERRTRQTQRQAEKEVKSKLSSEAFDINDYELVCEYLEDGTIEIVTAYRKVIPGQ